MFDWLVNDVLQANVPKLVGALLALAAAHSSLLQGWGVTVDWNTLGGKLTLMLTLLIGMLAGHHATKAVKGAASNS